MLAQSISLWVVGGGAVEFDSLAPYYCVPELRGELLASIRVEVRRGAKTGDSSGNECPWYLRGHH